jgi:predicted AAA+ superfamily ATPase
LLDAYLFYAVDRYDIRGKRRFERNQKYYLVDTGIRTALLGRSSPDSGRLLENTIYLELRRRRANVFVGQIDGSEVDFVAEHPDGTEYIQVAETVATPPTLERELRPLQRIPDSHPRLLLTMDTGAPCSHNGINQFYVPDWLDHS